MIGYFIFFFFLVLFSQIPNKQRTGRLIFIVLTVLVFSAIRYGMSYDYHMYLRFILSNYTHKELMPSMLELLARNLDFPQLFFILSSVYIYIYIMVPVYKKTD
jgi:hypothetical protein